MLSLVQEQRKGLSAPLLNVALDTCVLHVVRNLIQVGLWLSLKDRCAMKLLVLIPSCHLLINFVFLCMCMGATLTSFRVPLCQALF